jgi:hypothetical protein
MWKSFCEVGNEIFVVLNEVGRTPVSDATGRQAEFLQDAFDQCID